MYELDSSLLNIWYTEDEGSNEDRSKLSNEEVVGLLALVSSFRIAVTLTWTFDVVISPYLKIWDNRRYARKFDRIAVSSYSLFHLRNMCYITFDRIQDNIFPFRNTNILYHGELNDVHVSHIRDVHMTQTVLPFQAENHKQYDPRLGCHYLWYRLRTNPAIQNHNTCPNVSIYTTPKVNRFGIWIQRFHSTDRNEFKYSYNYPISVMNIHYMFTCEVFYLCSFNSNSTVGLRWLYNIEWMLCAKYCEAICKYDI